MNNFSKRISIILSIIFLLALNYKASAQYASIFANNQTSWSTLHQQLSGYYTDSLSVSGDTLIYNVVYKKLDYYSLFLPNNPFFQGLESYLREDTASGKVWYMNEYGLVEKLIIDLNLVLGDSFNISGFTSEFYVVVDSVYFFGNKKHIRFDYPLLHNMNEKFEMIEGIGTNMGIAYKESDWFVPWPYLLCHHKDFINQYQNSHPLYSGFCNNFTGISNLPTYELLFIHPNPTKDNIYFSTEYFKKDININLFNSLGKKVKEEKQRVGIKGETSFSLQGLPPGLYLLTVEDGSNRYSSKIIKE